MKKELLNHQSIILILSILYIYFLSDLLLVVNEGPSIKLIFRLCIPIWGKLGIFLIEILESYNNDLHEWWNETISAPVIIAYVFKFIKWMCDHGIHHAWNLSMKYGIDLLFSYIIGKIFYNFIFYNYTLYYLFFSLLCCYGVYMRFDTSRSALVTISGKFIEMGMGLLISRKLHLIDDCRDYCIKNKNTWLSYTIKLIVGYYGNTDIDNELMSQEIADYIGVSYEECQEMYRKSLVKKGLSVVEVSKNIYNRLSSPFLYKSTKDDIIDITPNDNEELNKDSDKDSDKDSNTIITKFPEKKTDMSNTRNNTFNNQSIRATKKLNTPQDKIIIQSEKIESNPKNDIDKKNK